MKKIIYFANHSNIGSDNSEKHIRYALEKLGHKVFCIDENNYTKQEVVEASKDAQLFLFHKAGISDGMKFMRFVEILGSIVCPKVCWYWDKVWGDREAVVENLLPYIDKLFLSDETWMRRHNYENVSVLRQGIGTEDNSPGIFKKELETEIAFVGQLYGDRADFLEKLTARYGDKVRVFGNIFNRDLYDLMASTKIVVAPDSPSDDFYWSSRIYMILGSGGFLLHPKCDGLKKELKDKKHYVSYSSFDDLCEQIDYYLENNKKRVSIQKAGFDYVVKNLNYETRCQTMLEILNSGK